jgi:hypothetical protein
MKLLGTVLFGFTALAEMAFISHGQEVRPAPEKKLFPNSPFQNPVTLSPEVLRVLDAKKSLNRYSFLLVPGIFGGLLAWVFILLSTLVPSWRSGCASGVSAHGGATAERGCEGVKDRLRLFESDSRDEQRYSF